MPGDVHVSPGCCVDCLSAGGQTAQGKKLHGKQEGDRKRNLPVFLRSQNESFPPLFPELTGVSIKDSRLSVQPVSTYLPRGSSSAVLLSAVG